MSDAENKLETLDGKDDADGSGLVESVHWYEKSVEYQFIIEAIQKKIFSLIYPLDGPVEAAGDTIFMDDSLFILVEFKLTLNSLSAEYQKFKREFDEKPRDAFIRSINSLTSQKNFSRAERELLEELDEEDLDKLNERKKAFIGEHHFLVGGFKDENSPSGLGLQIAQYSDAIKPTKGRFTLKKIEEVKKGAVSKDAFDFI